MSRRCDLFRCLNLATRQCHRCKHKYYCSKTHQRQDYLNLHHQHCIPYDWRNLFTLSWTTERYYKTIDCLCKHYVFACRVFYSRSVSIQDLVKLYWKLMDIWPPNVQQDDVLDLIMTDLLHKGFHYNLETPTAVGETRFTSAVRETCFTLALVKQKLCFLTCVPKTCPIKIELSAFALRTQIMFQSSFALLLCNQIVQFASEEQIVFHMGPLLTLFFHDRMTRHNKLCTLLQIFLNRFGPDAERLDNRRHFLPRKMQYRGPSEWIRYFCLAYGDLDTLKSFVSHKRGVLFVAADQLEIYVCRDTLAIICDYILSEHEVQQQIQLAWSVKSDLFYAKTRQQLANLNISSFCDRNVYNFDV